MKNSQILGKFALVMGSLLKNIDFCLNMAPAVPNHRNHSNKLIRYTSTHIQVQVYYIENVYHPPKLLMYQLVSKNWLGGRNRERHLSKTTTFHKILCPLNSYETFLMNQFYIYPVISENYKYMHFILMKALR